jgi:hypothetical protein
MYNNEIICFNVCQFRRKAANYADYFILLWQLWQQKQACFNCVLMCVPFSADIIVFNTYNNEIIVF